MAPSSSVNLEQMLHWAESPSSWLRRSRLTGHDTDIATSTTSGSSVRRAMRLDLCYYYFWIILVCGDVAALAWVRGRGLRSQGRGIGAPGQQALAILQPFVAAAHHP